jgi:hypothetical protein
VHFEPPRVINEDRVQRARGSAPIATDMEIISYVRGELEHKDSMTG